MDYKLDLRLFKESSSGVNVDSPEDLVRVDYSYTPIALFFVYWFGTTRMPKKITFTCVKTNEEFEVLEERELIEHYMLYRKK